MDGVVLATATFDTNLPNRWRARGCSDNGVRAHESVLFAFSPAFPVSAPGVFLRADFDRSHPHLQPGPPSALPRPCYVDGAPREFMRLRGMMGIADQVALWLERAALTRLIDPEDEWEPTRRDHVDDVVVCDAGALRARVTRDADGVFLPAVVFRTDIAASNALRHLWLSAEPIPLGAETFGRLVGQGDQAALGVAVWPGRRPNGEAFVADRYGPETVRSVRDLVARAEELGCAGPLRARLQLVRGRLGTRRLARPLLIAVVLIARRPRPVAGQGSVLELCPYLLEVGDGDALREDGGSDVRLLMHRDEIAPDLLRRAAGVEPAPVRDWTLLGCGSLGSKLAAHLAREGRAPAVVADRALMQPHNYARHALLPLHRTEALVDVSKAALVLDALQRLGVAPQAYGCDVVSLCLEGTPEERAQLWPATHAFLVDATGSPSLTEVLCRPEAMQARPRAVETSLLGAGYVAYAGIEGPRSNPSVLDLQAEFYRLAGNDPALRALVFDARAQAITVGQGCSALTFPMTDAVLSTSAASLARVLADLHADGLPAEAGRLLVGRSTRHALDQTWTDLSIPPVREVSGVDGVVRVRVGARVAALIDAEIARSPDAETGGVIVGRFSDVANTFQVVDLMAAPPDSTFRRDAFTLGTEGLAAAIARLTERHGGSLYPLGTWHSHLEDTGPSRRDALTSLELALGQLFPVLLLIRTPSGFTFLANEALGDPEDPAA